MSSCICTSCVPLCATMAPALAARVAVKAAARMLRDGETGGHAGMQHGRNRIAACAHTRSRRASAIWNIGGGAGAAGGDQLADIDAAAGDNAVERRDHARIAQVAVRARFHRGTAGGDHAVAAAPTLVCWARELLRRDRILRRQRPCSGSRRSGHRPGWRCRAPAGLRLRQRRLIGARIDLGRKLARASRGVPISANQRWMVPETCAFRVALAKAWISPGSDEIAAATRPSG